MGEKTTLIDFEVFSWACLAPESTDLWRAKWEAATGAKQQELHNLTGRLYAIFKNLG